MKRRLFFLLLAIMAMTGMLKGQSKDDFSGVWYIANETNHASTNYATHWYLVPGADPQQPHFADAYFHNEFCNKSGKGDYTGDNYGDPAKQFLTTYQTNRDLNSIWIIVSAGDGYYNIIHAKTGRYVVYEPPYKDAGHRKSMHLESVTTPGDKHKFTITGSLNGPININPKSVTSGNMYFNPAAGVGNRLQYYGTGEYFHEGMIGLYSGSGDKSQWYFEDASSATELTPVISDVNQSTNTFTITSPAAAYSTIRFTTDGYTTPNANTGNTATSGIDIDITDNWDVLAVGVFGTFVTPVAGPKSLNPTKCATPVISFDYTTLKVSITCATSNTTIYYTTDGDTPTTGSTEYSVPFSVTGTTTVKAIATHANIPNSEVAELAITQVATPTIQNNGSNAISITSATPGTTIYYTIDGSTPSTSSSQYYTPLQENVSGVTIKAIAVKENMITSAVGSGSVTLQCEAPIITRSSNTSFTVTCPFPTSDVTIYYTTNGSAPSTSSSSIASGGTVTCTLPVTVKAFATATNYDNSTVTTTYLTQGMGGDGSVANPYTIEYQSDVADFVTKANTPSEASKHYKVIATGTLDFSGAGNITQTFSGTFDGGTCVLTGLSHPLFDTVDGGVVKNVTLKSVDISSSADTVGAIACKAMGYSRIYNCGILPDTAAFSQGTHPSVTTEGNCAGGLVGSLRDDSRVINCYSYADVQATNTASGIVGYNAFASTAEETGGRYTKLRTAIVNCMFYGDINGGTNQYGVYGGELITNASTSGISSYNYFRNGSKFNATNGHPNTSGGSNVVGNPTAYNCSFPAEERYLTQVEFHRSLLNSNRELCGWWVGSDVAPSQLSAAQVQAVPKDASLIYKWVVDPNIAPYPILKPFGKYPSIVNGNTGTPWFDRTTANPYEGKQLGTLTVTVKSGSHSSAGDKTRYIPITDMDTLHYDFGYRKVQLPYYNTVFGDPDGANWEAKYACNYTDSVVTGWKVTAVDHEGDSAFVANWEHGYNFAERKCTDKDIYSNSNPRVFAQGGNYYVPDGVSAITIEAYWGKAFYVCDDSYSYDRVNITEGSTGTHFAPAGTRNNNFNGYTLYNTKIRDVIDNITEKKTVYDHAIVLVGNVQESNGNNAVTVSTNNTIGFTIMSVDLDFDEEPDYCLEWQLGTGTTRNAISPVRFDFLPVVELGIAGKLHNSTNFFSLGCFRSCGHFEVTETAFIRFGQFEFERKTRDNGPIILNGGIFDQYTRGTAGDENTNNGQHITYIILGGHVVMPSFTPGAHVNGGANYATRHCAVNALGGDFSSFYLTGGYNENVTPFSDNPHCYIDGGRFGTIAAAYKEGITGNVFWRINHALIGEFYGGGMMSDDNKVVKGNIDVVIDNSIVGKYCGGPKFGNMMEGKTVTTSATGTTFYHFYGAGNGGTNYVQFANDDKTDGPRTLAQWLTLLNGKYSPKTFINQAKGYHANFDYEEINPSTGTTKSGSIDRIYYYSAQFATTNTGNITSTLTNCIVKNNFYGAGFLGGVNGKVESTLIDCTVQGSVFGAGYSASVPKVNIYNTDRTPPTANTYTGLITPQSGGTYTSYTWCDTVGTTGTPVTYDTLFYTDISLDNLGAVSNNVTLTLKGNTTVGTLEGPSGSQTLKAGTGNVFGGGDQSAVNGNTTVNIQEGTTILGNVYGGGNEGPVGGDSEVIIQDD